MKSTIKHLLLTLLVLFVSTTALATPVGPLNYQGRLLDENSIPVTGSYNFTVRVYNALTVGTLKYEEQHNSISVEDGVYSFEIGTQTPTGGDSAWDVSLWQLNLNNLFLEVAVNGQPLTPRHKLTSAPHAFTATLALSLGNKTAEEFDNILEGVCVASKGKWLDNIERCLGAAATVINENAATMASNLDYSDLDLSKADLTNTVFNNVNFSNTVFKNTNLTISGFSGANLTGARLDGVVSSNSMPNMSINLTNATLTNMSLSGWNLSGATVTGLSAANLTACPSSLPASWQCAEMKSGSGTYFLFGPGANLSAESVAAISKHGFRLLNMDDDHFINKNLAGANFEGVDLSSVDFSNANLSNANLDYTTILSGSFNNANLNGTSFRFSQITSTLLNTATLDGNDFSNANIKNSSLPSGGSDMIFKKATLKNLSIGSMTDADFSYALLDYITFTGDMFGTLNFTYTNFWNVVDGQLISSATLQADNITAFGEGIIGGFNIPFPPGTVLNNPTFDNVTLQSNLDSVTFNNGRFHKTEFSSNHHAYNAIFNNCQVSESGMFAYAAVQPPSFNGSIFTGGSIAGLSTNMLSIDSSAFVNGGLNVSFTNVAFSYTHFTGIWQLMPNPSCAGCTFTNTQWTTIRCPNSGLGSPAFEEPAGSGIYQCPGWY